MIRKLIVSLVIVVIFTTLVIAQTRVNNEMGARTWYYAQDRVTVAAQASPDTATWTNSFFNAMIWTNDDSTWFKVGSYYNGVAAVDSFVYLPANVFFPIPSVEGVKSLIIKKGVDDKNDAGMIFIAGDKLVTE